MSTQVPAYPVFQLIPPPVGRSDRQSGISSTCRRLTCRADRRPAASTTRLAEGSTATQSMPTGWCLTSRRCSTTTRSCPASTSSAPGDRRPPRTAAPPRRPSLTTCCATCGTRRRILLRDRRGQRGERGPCFVWTPAEVAALLEPADVELACRYWDITKEGNFEGKSIAHVTLTLEQVGPMMQAGPAEAARVPSRSPRRLLRGPSRRVPPARDDKILIGWNAPHHRYPGGRGTGDRRARWISAAVDAAEFLYDQVRSAREAAPRMGRGSVAKQAPTSTITPSWPAPSSNSTRRRVKHAPRPGA